jgi:hypothetical protein
MLTHMGWAVAAGIRNTNREREAWPEIAGPRVPLPQFVRPRFNEFFNRKKS